MAEKKEKQYVSDNAQLMTEWNWERNTDLGFNPQILAFFIDFIDGNLFITPRRCL